jgi:WD40 repeat protein
MAARWRMLLFAVLLCLSAAFIAPAAPIPDKAEPAGTDASGDPLPPGILARLGSARLYHPDVFSIAFSPDDKTLASLDGQGTLCLWELSSGKELHRFSTPPFRGYSSSSTPVAFSADSKLVALGCADNTVRIWETATGKERHKFEGLPGVMDKLRFDPRGRQLAAGGYGGPVQLFDLQAGKALEPRGDFKTVVFLAWSTDGKTLTAVGSQEDYLKRTLCQFDTASGKEEHRRAFVVEIFSGLTYTGALSPDGTVLATPIGDTTVIGLYEAATGKELHPTEGKANRPGGIHFSGDSKALTATDLEGNVRVWASASGKLLHEFKALKTSVRTIALSHDVKLVAVAGRQDGAIHVFDAAKRKELHTFVGHRDGPLRIAFSADGRTVFTVSRDRGHISPPQRAADWSLRQWDPQTGKELRVTQEDLGGEVYWTAFSPDGRLLLTVMHNGTLRLWDTEGGKELRNWKVPTYIQTVNPGNVKSPVQAISQPAFSADGKMCFTTSFGKIHRWEVKTGEELPVLDIPDGAKAGGSTSCFPMPDGDKVLVTVTPGGNTRVAILDASSGRLLRSLGESRSTWPACAFSSDGQTVAFADEYSKTKPHGVALREVASGIERGWLEVTPIVSELTFSPDGRLLAIGTGQEVRLMHLLSGREVGRVDAFLGRVQSLAFSPDGKLLAVAGYANTALICDVAAVTAGKIPKPAKLTAKDLEARWNDLKSSDGIKAYRAIAELSESPEESLPFLKERLRVAPIVEERHIEQLIAQLDDNSFDVRQKAGAALEKLGKRAEPALTRAVAKTESEEVRRRARSLLQKLQDADGPALPGEELIQLRALEAVANMRTPDAGDVLKTLAKGDGEARVTQQAKAALKRRTEGVSPP